MDTAGSHTWDDVLAGVQTLAELIQTCQDAFGEDEAAPKVSVTTKKRLTVRAMQGLHGGSQLVQALAANMRELQQAVQQQQEELQQATNSNQDLQQQLRGSNDECHSSKRALLQAESQKMGMQQQVEQLQQQLRLATAEKQDLQETIQDLQNELHGAAQQAADARTHLNQLQQQMEQLAAAAKEAEAGADAAAGALEAAREQADKEQAARARHEDAVARLTADNLVFMARLRAAEADAAAAIAERDEYKMALEQHKGPWMDEVHQGVELRVKAAMARAEQLEAQQELAAAQHAQHVQQLQQQHADLEAALQASQQLGAELREQLVAAQTAAFEARTAAEEAAVLASSAQAAADERAAELRVAQESLRSMREECNERWMSERAARTQIVELQERLDAQDATVLKLQKQLQARSDGLATQRAVNQQLMMKKEEVEWQLLAAIAQLHNHQPAASAGSPESLGTQDSMDNKQQQQQVATATSVADAPAGSLPEHLPSPFGASALLPLSPVQQHAAGQLPAGTNPPPPPPAAAVAGTGGLRISTGGGVSAGLDVAPLLPSLPVAAEVPGPAAVAAGGGLWQLPNGSSSGLFGSRVSSAGGGHPLAAIANPMPAATAAAVGALLGNKGVGELHHAFSCPEGDMYSLPRLGFGLATLPTPEQLLAAAEAAATGSGSLQKTVTIGRAGSLTVPVSADGSNSNHVSSSGGTGDTPSAGTIAAAVAAAAGGASAGPSLTITRDGRTSSDGPGSVTFRPPVMQPMLLGTTGGLMAPFSPLSPGAKGPSSSASRGAVFPECITASAVTDSEQLELGCFGFAGLTDALQQQQQQVLGPGFWYLQQQQQQQPQQHHPQQAKQRHGSSGSLSDGGQHANHSSSACASSGSLHEAQQQQHNSNNAAGASGAGAPGGAAAVGATVSAFASTVKGDGGLGSQRNSNDSRDSKDEGADSNASSLAGSNAHLHGILRNAPNSRARSPLTGVSPSGSMKSVRFSFEGLDSAAAEQGDSDHEQLGDQKGGRRSGSNSNARGSVSPPTSRGQGRSSSEWLRHTLYEQLASHSRTAHAASPRGVAGSPNSSLGGGSSHHADYHSGSGYNHHHAYDSQRPRRHHHRDGSSGGGSSRQAHGWPASSHPPARAPGGGQYMGRFAEGRQGHSSVQDMIRAQQRQVRQQQVAKEVAAMAAAVKDRAQPKAPVHPIFGVMHTAGDSGSGHPAA